MPRQTGDALTMDALVTDLLSFATSNGWTQDEVDLPNGVAALHNTNGRCFASFRWNTSAPNNLGVYHALGWRVGVTTVVPLASGSGYVVGDVLTISAGTSTQAAQVTVTSVDGGGGVTGARVSRCGINYTTTPATSGSSGGTGGGATFTLTYSGSPTALPGQHCDDSGRGIITSVDSGTTSLERSRCLQNLGAGPFRYWFFAEQNPDTLYVVVRRADLVYRHLALGGDLERRGDWIGGSFVCGQVQYAGTNSTRNCALLDGAWFNPNTSGTFDNTENQGPTVHIEGIYAQPATSKWGAVYNTVSSNSVSPDVTTDRDGRPHQRMFGGYKANTIAAGLGWVASNPSNGFTPFISIPAYYADTSASPEQIALLGFMPNIRAANIRGFDAEQEVVIGSQTWQVFPQSRKATNSELDDSKNAGIAYLVTP